MLETEEFMAIDVYSPCPCGSGKKLKFCCHAIVGEMERVNQLQRSNQLQMALRALDELEESYPKNLWVCLTKAGILFGQGRAGDAKQSLSVLLEFTPDHPTAIALYAVACLQEDGFESAKPAIHRAFQKCIPAVSDVMSTVAFNVSVIKRMAGQFMAARQHLALAMRLAHESLQQQIFMQLLQLDGSTNTPYPTRGVHELQREFGNEQLQGETHRAFQLSDIGCWQEAAAIFDKLAEQQESKQQGDGQAADQAKLLQNAGLCHAWDGEESTAAETLRRAARLHDDVETSVECETIAQLLDLGHSKEGIKIVQAKFNVQSISKLLTMLDVQDRFLRLEIGEPDEQTAKHGPHPSGVYRILNCSKADFPAAAAVTRDNVPTSLATVTLFPENNQNKTPPRAVLIGVEGDEFDSSLALLTEAAGDEIKPDDLSDEERVVDVVASEFFGIQQQWQFPNETPVVVQRTIEKQHWQSFVDEVWPNNKMAALGGKSPLEAVGDAELQVPLMAGVYVLDACSDSEEFSLDVEAVRERLNLPKPAPMPVDADTPLSALSIMQLSRLPLKELTDSQLVHALNRALLMHRRSFLYPVLVEIDARPSCHGDVDMNRIYMTLTDLCQDELNYNEALDWIAKGLDHSTQGEQAFENELQWKLRELTVRVDDPSDPELSGLMQRLWDYYGEKLPELRQHLATLVAERNLPAPWESAAGIITADAGGAAIGDAGVWSPSAGEPSQGDEKKLWLPGQD